MGSGAAFAAGGSPTSGFSFMGDLASHLGVSPATLDKAIRQTELDRVNYLLDAGKITPAKAQKLERAIAAGRPVLRPGRRMLPMRLRRGILVHVAKAIGITPKELMTDLRGGKTLEEVITASGKSPGTVEADLASALRARLDRAVASGHLTAAREAKILADFPARFQKLLTRTFPAPPKNMAPNAPPSPATPG